MKARCLWCGKKLDIALLNQEPIVKKKTPKFLAFSKCPHCHNYYGQYSRTKYNLFCGLFVCLFLILGIMTSLPIFYGLTLLSALATLLTPYRKMTENEDLVEDEPKTKYRLTFIDPNIRLGISQFYFFTDDFDYKESFSQISPICTDAHDNKNESYICHFLYEHPQNETIINSDNVKIFDDRMCYLTNVRIELI